ncbi:MAG: signal recognition particle-docking protein FtsY [Gemmatimonadota bacterium]
MRGGLWKRIKEVALTDVTVLVRGLDHDTLEQVERVLVEADFGPAAFVITEELEQQLRRGTLKSTDAVRKWLEERIAEYLPETPDAGALNLGDGTGPAVILVFGVNGVGKTTSIAKLAHRLIGQGKSVLLAAADTYRAGATEQLRVWADRLDVQFVSGTQGGDPAAVAFDAIEAAIARNVDVVLVDTAGRLHTHSDLMEELQKIARVVGRKCPGGPHESLLVLDATVGQNALLQGKTFADAVPLTGIVLAKLDSTAKGGAVLLVQRELGVPIRFVGVGETLDALEPFSPQRFAEQLLAD